MFDSQIIVDGTVRNVEIDGAVVGFEFDTRITYYRGLGLSMVEPFEVIVDGEPIPTKDLRFSLHGKTWTFEELSHEFETTWELLDVAVLRVLKPDGLTPGEHTLDVTEILRVSYMPVPSRSHFVRKVTIA